MAKRIYFPLGETWRHLLLARKLSYSMKCVEQLNKKYYTHSSALHQIPPERAKSFPLVTTAARRTPIPLWEVNHCGGTAVHSPAASRPPPPPWTSHSGCWAPSVLQALGDLGVECCLLLVSSLFYSNDNNHKYFYPSQPPQL